MRYRVQTFGGRFEVRSAPGAGTRVMAEIAVG
jgi:signal transduction histidine kinase